MQGARAAKLMPWAVTGLAIVVFLLHCGRYWWFTIDDAAISMSYAWNAAHGHGWALTRDAAPVEGFSNPLWVAVMVGPAALGVPLEPLVKVLGVLCAAGAMVLLVAAARRAGSGGWAVVAAALLALTAGYALWAQAGLENGLWALACAGAVACTLRELDDAAARPWSALPLAALLWIRPEAPLVLALFAAVRAAVVWRRRLPWRREWTIAAAVIGGAALLLVLRRWLFHDWLPNSYYAKRYERLTTAIYFRRGARYLGGFVRDYRLYALAWLPVLALWRARARPAAVLALGLVVASAAFAWFAGGDWAHDHRFLTGAWVGLALLAALACAQLAEWLPRARWAAPALLGGLFVWTAVAKADAVRHDIQFRVTPRARAGDCFRLHALSETLGRPRPLILAIDVGGMSYCGVVEVLDYIGLADRTIPLLRDHDPTHREYLHDERAWDFTIGRGELPRALRLTPEMHLEYLQFRVRAWHPGLLLFARRELVMAPLSIDGARVPVGDGLAVRGARVTPARAAPGGAALVELPLVIEGAARTAAPWPVLDLEVRGPAGGVGRARAEAIPGALGLSPLSLGDAILVRARITIPADADAHAPLEVLAGGQRVATILVGEPALGAPTLELPEATLAAMLAAPAGEAFAARRLLALRAEHDRLAARAHLLGLPAPAPPPALRLAGRVAAALVRPAAGLPPDAAYNRYRLAFQLAPKRADIVRALDRVRQRRVRRYSFLERELGIDLERRVRLGEDALRDDLAAVYLEEGRDAEALAVATRPCPRAVAAANLALAAAPSCALWDPVRARYALAFPTDDHEGFERGLAWTPAGDWPHAAQPNAEPKTPVYRPRWSGQLRAASGAPAARGTLTSPPWPVRHRYLTFLLSTGVERGRAAPSPDGAVTATLVIDGRAVETAVARPDDVIRVVWDLGPYRGQIARVVLTDDSGTTWLAADAFTWLAPVS